MSFFTKNLPDEGIEILTYKYDVNKEEILAIGNSLNDLPMIKYASVGLATKNSDPMLLNK